MKRFTKLLLIMFLLIPMTINAEESNQEKTVRIIYSDRAGNNIIEPDYITGKVGEAWSAKPKEIEGYKFVGEAKEYNGVFEEDDQEIFAPFYYEKIEEIKEGTVRIIYSDKAGNDVIEPDYITGKIGESWSAKPKEIEGYKFVGESKEHNGVFEEEEIFAPFYYEKIKEQVEEPNDKVEETPEEKPEETPAEKPAETVKEGSIKLIYIDADGNNIINSEIIKANLGETWTAKAKIIDGYKFIGDKEEYSGTYKETETVITFNYEKTETNKESVWDASKDKDGLEFIIDAAIDDFEGLFVDGNELTTDKDFIVKDGSIIITLLPDYLKTLENETYELKVLLKDDIEHIELFEVVNNEVSKRKRKSDYKTELKVGLIAIFIASSIYIIKYKNKEDIK